MSGKSAIAERSVTAQNRFTSWVKVQKGDTLDIGGLGTSFVGTWTVERRFRESDPSRIVEQYTSDVERLYDAGSNHEVRVGVRTGDFGSGSIDVYIKRN